MSGFLIWRCRAVEVSVQVAFVGSVEVICDPLVAAETMCSIRTASGSSVYPADVFSEAGCLKNVAVEVFVVCVESEMCDALPVSFQLAAWSVDEVGSATRTVTPPWRTLSDASLLNVKKVPTSSCVCVHRWSSAACAGSGATNEIANRR